MKILKVIGVVSGLLVVVLAAFFFFFKAARTPVYKGELKLDGLSEEVQIYFTEFGIPHIYGTTAEDTYHAFGYVIAQDRLWQMDLLRHVGRRSVIRAVRP